MSPFAMNDFPQVRRVKPRRIKPRRPVPESVKRFAFLCAMANSEGAPGDCPRQECKRRRQCCGGPRGTLRRLAGLPFCRTEAVVTKVEEDRWRAGYLRTAKRSHGERRAAEKFAEIMDIEKVK